MKTLNSEFNLENVKCAGCVGKIESKLSQIDGVSDARVNLLEKTLVVKYTDHNLDKQVVAAVKSLGYGATLDESSETKMNLSVNVGLPILIGLFMMTFGMTNLFMQDYTTFSGFRWGICEAILTLVIITLTGRSIFKFGLNGFLTLNFNMHSLIILGVGAAWFYSTWVIIVSYFLHYTQTGHVYFESSLIIIGLINFGAYLEDRAKGNTTNAIKALIALQPNETIIIKDFKEQVINTNLLRAGDIIKIKPGERIAADGKITSGDGYIDESMLTGEPLPIHKKIGDSVITGSINVNGVFLFTVEQIGSNTVLSGIINLVKSAQMSKPALARIADKVAQVFVPAIILIAILTAIIWWFIGPDPRIFYTITIFMTVLIIACPCSVGLAIPVSLMVGLGRSAAKGVLIRNASCLSKIVQLDYVLLDKTGTITEGRPTVVALTTDFGYSQEDCLLLLKALESNSEHPLANAILNYKLEIQSNLTVTDFIMVSGSGISGKINDRIYFAGTKKWIENQHHSFEEINTYIMTDYSIEKNHSQRSNLFINNHHTQVFLADESRVLARIDISDAIKVDSPSAIKQLHQRGINVAMVTGDNENNANYVANLVGIDSVFANCKPQDKINIVKDLQQSHVVAFVGDGINDAPSLVQADIGIAIGSGTDIAMQSADITLMRSSLAGVHDAITIGQAINRNMQQNLFGSFIYNSLAVLIATGIFYPVWHILLNPVIASVAMSLSSITVILNALRLRKL